jgi:hypothetical protein
LNCPGNRVRLLGVSVAPVIEDGEVMGIVAHDQLVLNGLAGQL